MNLLPPRVLGPLSECSRSVIVSNVFIGATVTLIITRGGVDRRVGTCLEIDSLAPISFLT
ncbi:MAG TPA: hypothetical protein VK666_23150 [Chryseolinea sp.]|nr:hypothetical protein [Chryseolinea sp.]